MVSEIGLIEEMEKQHPDEWLEFEVIELAADGFTPLKGRLVAHGKNRQEVVKDALAYFKQQGTKHRYTAYTGDIKVQSVLL